MRTKMRTTKDKRMRLLSCPKLKQIVISRMILVVLFLCNFVLEASAVYGTTLTRVDSKQAFITTVELVYSIRKVSETVPAVNAFECKSRCLQTPKCTLLFYDTDKTCSFYQLSGCINSKSVNISEAGTEEVEIWMDTINFLAQKSLINSTNGEIINRTFTNSSTGPHGSVQTKVVATTGCYKVTAKGARSGRQTGHNKDGCLGAVNGGSFLFNAGDELRVVVGQEGGPTRPSSYVDGSGAGGASFVFTQSGDLLLAAGGAGGVRDHKDSNCAGQAGLKAGHSWDGGNNLHGTGYGGENGTTGGIGPNQPGGNDGGVGASWFSSGPPVRAGETWGGRPGHNMSGNFSGGLAPPNNNTIYGLFKAHGGFGGGGSGSPYSYVYGNGGSGGGYSSGGVGSFSHTGGGGSSFASPMATNVWGITGGNTEAHGSVTFTYTGLTCC